MDTRKKLAAGLAAAVGLGAAALGIEALHPATAQAPPPPPPPMMRPHGDRDHDRDDRRVERHPEIRAALRNLNQAKNNLQRAAHDFGGHREQALDLTQRAIDQCQQALRDDRH